MNLSPLLCYECDRPITSAAGIHAYCAHCGDYKRTYTADLGKSKKVLEMPKSPEQKPIELFGLQGTVEVVSLKKRRSVPKGVTYVGRHSDRLHQHESVLANPFKIDRDGSRSEVCDLFREKVLYPALDAKNGRVWDEISQLADRVLRGEAVKLGCPGCLPNEECHAADIAAAVNEVARGRARGAA